MTKQNIEKGDIWLVNLNPARRGELGKSSRPCIIIQATEANKFLPTVMLVPLSTKKQKFELDISILPDNLNNLKKESHVVWWHVYTVNKINLLEKIGIVNNEILIEISQNIIDTLGFSNIFE